MAFSEKLVVELIDLATCSTSNNFISHDNHRQQSPPADQTNDVEIVELSDCESICSLPRTIRRNVNGMERNLSWDKKLVVKLCDFMVCSKKNCDVLDYKKYREKEEIQKQMKRKVDHQHFPSRKKPPVYKELTTSEEEYTSEEADDSDWEEMTISEKKKEKEKQMKEKNKRKQKEQKKKQEETTSEEEYTSEEVDDSDWEEMTVSEKKKEKEEKKKEKEEKRKEKEKQKEQKKKQTENLSSFELTRQKHVDDKMAFLKSLMMNEIVDDLEEIAKSQTRKKPRKSRVFQPKGILEASRKSKRMENVTIDLSEQALESKAYDVANTEIEKLKLPSDYPFEEAFCGDAMSDDYEKYFTNLEIKEEVSSNTNFLHDLGRLDGSRFTSYTYPFLLSSLAFHPAVDRTILLAGSTNGRISLWNTQTEAYHFAPHTECVTHVNVNPECPSMILSSSNDGTLRQIDIEKQCFLEVFNEEHTQCKYFDFISPREFLVAQADGYVSMVDCRENRFRSGFKSGFRTSATWKCSNKKIRTISSHPTKKDLCLSLDADGFMKVWDRRLQKKTVSCITESDANVISAFFSPITGNSILCSSKLSIRIYDSSRAEQVLRLLCMFDIQHNITKSNIELLYKMPRKKFKKIKCSFYTSQSNHYTLAKWLPGSDSAFLVSNNERKKTSIIGSHSGQEMSSFKHEGGVAVFQEVHPLHNKLALSYCPSNLKCKMRVYFRET